MLTDPLVGRTEAQQETIQWMARIHGGDHVEVSPDLVGIRTVDGHHYLVGVGGDVTQLKLGKSLTHAMVGRWALVGATALLTRYGWRRGQRDGLWRHDDFGGSYGTFRAMQRTAELYRRHASERSKDHGTA